MKKLLILILTLLMAGSLTAAQAESQVYASWYTFGDVYLTDVRAALDAALAERGMAATDMDENGVRATQIDDVTRVLFTGADAVAVNLVESGDMDAALNLLESARAQDRPVVFFNRAVSLDNDEAAALFLSYGKSAFVGTDFEKAGRLEGQMIGEYLLAHYDEADLNGDGEISYVLFKGEEANQEAILRTRYAQEVADELLTAAGKPALRFYDETNGDKYLVDRNGTWSNVASYAYMQTILSHYNEENGNMVELVICNNDDMAVGAIKALAEAGYNTGDAGDRAIPVFGVDAVAEARELIHAGRMAGTVKQDAAGMAEAVAQILANLTAGRVKFDGLDPRFRVVDGWFVQIPYAPYTGQ